MRIRAAFTPLLVSFDRDRRRPTPSPPPPLSFSRVRRHLNLSLGTPVENSKHHFKDNLANRTQEQKKKKFKRSGSVRLGWACQSIDRVEEKLKVVEEENKRSRVRETRGEKRVLTRKVWIRCFRCCSGIISFFSRINKNRTPLPQRGEKGVCCLGCLFLIIAPSSGRSHILFPCSGHAGPNTLCFHPRRSSPHVGSFTPVR